jgi:hypothetical protein
LSKRPALLLIVILAVSSFTMVESAFAQSITKPSVPEFTLQYVDNSYDVPPKTTTTTDPYTNETITATIPGYHVENKTVEATINNNIGASYYNFKYKGSYTDKWNYYPFDPNASLPYFLSDSYSVPYKASTSSYTVAALPPYFFKDVPDGGKVDVQVQALFGDFRAEPFGHIFLPLPTYDFYFEGTTSDWNNTQTLTISESQTPTSLPTPTSTPYQEPQQTEQIMIISVAITVTVFGLGLGLLIYLIKRK